MITSIDLIDQITARLDITREAASYALDTYISQVETLENREIDQDNITQEDADFLTGAVFAGHQAGDFGTRELWDLQEKAQAVEEARDMLKHAESERDKAIRAALDSGCEVKDIVPVTGVSRARIYQIRDGRR